MPTDGPDEVSTPTVAGLLGSLGAQPSRQPAVLHLCSHFMPLGKVTVNRKSLAEVSIATVVVMVLLVVVVKAVESTVAVLSHPTNHMKPISSCNASGLYLNLSRAHRP